MILAGPEALFLSQALEAADIARASAASSAFAFHHPAVLGTRLNLLVHASDETAAAEAERRAMLTIRRLERVLDRRDPESELSRLNRSASFTASGDLFAVIGAAERWSLATRGAFSARIGAVLDLWRRAGASEPARDACARLAADAASADVRLDPATRTIARPDAVSFDVDALAKGYIVDRALEAAAASPGVSGALLDIGGDIRCSGAPAGGDAWLAGLPDPLSDADNAPLDGLFSLRDAALATSGFGPPSRAFAGGAHAGLIDPRTGWPAERTRSATTLARTAMDADALATAFAVLTDREADDVAGELTRASVRITSPEGSRWLGAGPPQAWRPMPVKDERPAQSARGWPDGWVVLATFQAPPRQMKRDRAFRSPYVAIWVTDEQNRPVRTLLLVGTIKEWQQDNYVWWGQNRASAVELLDVRSMSTRGSGEYKVLWDGNTDAGERVPAGRYIVHIETSRERGRHTHRSVALDLTASRPVAAELPQNEESGGLSVSFQRF